MRVTDRQLATVRAYLSGDVEEFERSSAAMERTGDVAGYAALVSAAFREAVERRFGQDRRLATIIRFVAAERAKYSTSWDELDPQAAEGVIREALGDDDLLATELDATVRARTQFLVLSDLIAEEQLDEEGLAEFLVQARMRAERILDKEARNVQQPQ